MPPPIEPGKRAAIEAAIRSGGTCRGIAREYGVSPASVRNIATQAGITEAFERTATARATAAKQADNAARRAALGQALLDDAARLRERLWQPSVQLLVNGDTVTLDLPPARDVRDFMTGVQSGVKAHLDLDRHDSDDGAKDAASLVKALAAGLQVAAGVLDSEGEGDDADRPRQSPAEPQATP